jgi:hypothetical protein
MMETAKVDIRKLQLLNDRINQLFDALNQVRLSVHGLSHTAPMAPGTIPGYPMMQVPFAQFPVAPGYFPGISHTAALPPTPGMFVPGLAPQAPMQLPWQPFLGLSHTSPEDYTRTWMTDPFFATKIGQTFPYAQFVLPPVVPIY